jgi:hypothetical protein
MYTSGLDQLGHLGAHQRAFEAVPAENISEASPNDERDLLGQHGGGSLLSRTTTAKIEAVHEDIARHGDFSLARVDTIGVDVVCGTENNSTSNSFREARRNICGGYLTLRGFGGSAPASAQAIRSSAWAMIFSRASSILIALPRYKSPKFSPLMDFSTLSGL